MPFSSDSLPAKRTSAGVASASSVAGISTPFGITRELEAPSSRASSASASETAITSRARRSAARASGRTCRARATSVPCSVTTNGFPAKAATAPEGSQCACTRSASRAALRTARVIAPTRRGAAQGLRRRLLGIPPGPASPNDPKTAGETTSIATPRSRRRSTASATKRPLGSSSSRG